MKELLAESQRSHERPLDQAEGNPFAAGPPLCLRMEVAQALLGIRKTKMYELIAAGEIEAIKIGRATLVLRESLEAFVARAPRL